MNFFERIKIEGYRRLHNVEIEMRPLTVMIGANGVGKTSLLEIFSLLAASANSQLEPKISELGGLSEIITRDRANKITISLSRSSTNNILLDYHLEVALTGFYYQIILETLTHERINLEKEEFPSIFKPFRLIESHGSDIKYFNPTKRKLLRPSWKYNRLETSLSQVPKMYQSLKILGKT